MPVYKIRRYPDPLLRKKSLRVWKVTAREKKILAGMVETMYSAKGIGLAAPQIGVNLSLVVADAGDGLVKLVNPEIVLREGKSKMEEGCLSLPGVYVDVERAESVVVQGWDEKGKEVQIQAKGLFAHVLQHEIDHLGGILIIDRGRVKEKSRDAFLELEKNFKKEKK